VESTKKQEEDMALCNLFIMPSGLLNIRNINSTVSL